MTKVPVCQPLADPALAVTPAVDVRGVDEAPAGGLVGRQQFVGRLAVCLQIARRRLAAEPPGPEGDLAHLEPCLSHSDSVEFQVHTWCRSAHAKECSERSSLAVEPVKKEPSG